MKVALLHSVVVLVAVSQPQSFYYPPHPFQPCNLIGVDMQCCFPQAYGGCRAPPGLFPPRMPLPRGYKPPRGFLDAVCCPGGTECCPVDQTSRFPTYLCCDTDEGESCNIVDQVGECIEAIDGNGTTPDYVEELEAEGQCPRDGSLPLTYAPGRVIPCSLNTYVSGYECPDDAYCVRDNSGNANSGVCCPDTLEVTACSMHEDCVSCVTNDEAQAPCGWLSGGSLSNNDPRCVFSCDNFPGRSCIVPHDGEACPPDLFVNRTDGFNANTGTCKRRCGYVGTGRAAGLTNDGNWAPAIPNGTNITATDCCTDHPGDYCCSNWGELAAHCARGRLPGGPLCGVPVKGTPNTLYKPQREPLGPYQAGGAYGPYPVGPYGPRPYGPYRPPPYGPYGPMPYGFVPYGPAFRSLDGKDSTMKLLMLPPPPMYYPPMPPKRPIRIPPIAEVNPSPFVCSCDDECLDLNDCCEDFEEICVESVAPTAAPSYMPTYMPTSGLA